MDAPLKAPGLASSGRNVWRRLLQGARLCCGLPDYESYSRHFKEVHPERPVPDYATFFRERQGARYRGGRGTRCC
ncbi:MAG TPA: CstA-like transporter-associated (seleno)protein [Woeseiaceae bacterium]